MTRYRSMLLAFMVMYGCTPIVYTEDKSGGTAGGLPCPGPQCPCPCEAPLVCTPANTCGLLCGEDSVVDDSVGDDHNEMCSGVQGETCLGGMCGVVCTVGGLNDCTAVGMQDANCVTIENTAVCAYKP